MELEKQVTSVELSNKLKKLGVTTPSLFFRDWTGAKEDEIEQNIELAYNLDNVNCYTVAELGDMLPNQIITAEKVRHLQFAKMQNGLHRVAYYSLYAYAPKTGYFTADTEADARAKMLVYLLENNLLK